MKEMRLLMVQFGDYREAMEGQKRGKAETYRAQYHSMDLIKRVAANGSCMVICLDTEPYNVNMDNFTLVGDRFIPSSRGLRFQIEASRAARAIISHAEKFNPSHLIIRTPGWVMNRVGSWALKRNIALLPLFADLFYSNGFKDKLKNLFTLHLLNSPKIKVVANHNIPACRSMEEAGVRADKIIPYDWPAVRHPAQFPVKSLLPEKQAPEPEEKEVVKSGRKPLKLLFAGNISQAKGVGDLIKAVELLVRNGIDLKLDICGSGPDMELFKEQVNRMNLTRSIIFHGTTPNMEVVKKMEMAHLVVVPSRHNYPEGLPNVIYEGLETRTPVICSDHPAFMMRLTDNIGCKIFKAEDPTSMAKAVEESIRDSQTYLQLSDSTLKAWEAIQCEVTFDQLVTEWISWSVSGTPLNIMQHALKPGV